MKDDGVLRQIAKAYARMEKFPRARGVAEKISDESSKAFALADIAKVRAEFGAKPQVMEPQAIGLLMEAREVAEKIGDESAKASALGKVAVAMAQVGAKQHEEDLLTEARVVAEKITGGFKVSALVEIAKAEAELGAKQQLKDLLTQAQEVAEKISEESYKVGGRRDLALRYAKLYTNPKKTLALTEKAFALERVAVAMAEMGAKQPDEKLLTQAQGVAEKISEESFKASALLKAAKAAAVLRNFSLARNLASAHVNKARELETLALILETEVRSNDPRLKGKIWED